MPNYQDNPISIIIPALNEAEILAATLMGLPAAVDVEVILVDGGSTDGTWELAGRFPHLRRLQAPRGRGCQMNAGARAARGRLLAFLHADTLLSPAHLAALRRAAADPSFAAGAFELSLTPPVPALRFIARAANWRSRFLGLPYGDQVLILRPDLLSPPVASSGRRWLELGYFATSQRHWLALARHLAERTCTKRWPEKGDLDIRRRTDCSLFRRTP
jgi:glycosyltransferase involved in cell wall biosynthesis